MFYATLVIKLVKKYYPEAVTSALGAEELGLPKLKARKEI